LNLLGQMLYSCQDEYGQIWVTDNGVRRLLSFGPGDEQSACLKSEPALLLFEYTQAMLLGLIFAAPRKVLCLGLGAGSLVTALHHHSKGVKITAVELRPLVIEIAQRYFYLPTSKNIQLHCADAGDFIQTDSERYDLIFCDLYTNQGASNLQSEALFLQACSERLKPQGVLVINSWRKEKLPPQEQLDLLSATFLSRGLCATGEGNWVLFGSKAPWQNQPQVLKAATQKWSQQLGYSLQKHWRNFREI
jgi:spermidine synthase